MSNNRITPFVKRMRTNGGTIYTFSSSVEDIGLNINERNNVVKISHFALLDIPPIQQLPATPPENIKSNRFNITNIAGAFEQEQGNPSLKDGRVLIAESFQNYALNLEANLLNQASYEPALIRTVTERVFWKWLKETGSIRWQSDVSVGGVQYFSEEIDADGSLGYNSVIKYIGLVSAGNVRQDTFGTYNETYILVPTSHGQTDAYFEVIEDSNYYLGMEIGNLGENILGRESYTLPHPDGLSYLGYYDFVDSSTQIVANGTTWSLSYDDSTGSYSSGWWYTAESREPASADNAYLTDSSSWLTSGILNTDLKYSDGSNTVQFRRSKLDAVSLVLDVDTLKSIYSDSTLSYEKLATEYSINDNFNFNAALIYYTVYNSTMDKVLGVNLLGILFLDAPTGNSANIPVDGIIIPALEKIQSGVGGFGTSYSLRLNIKTDTMVDDTGVPIVDEATSDQLYGEDWAEVFANLDTAVNILTQNNSTISYISEQYTRLSSTQTQILNDIKALEYQVNDIGRDIEGVPNVIAMFADGDDPLVESSIYMKFGNVGIQESEPIFPLQVSGTTKTDEIIIENAIRDTSGNVLLGYGSPLQLGSSTNYREISLFTGQQNPAIYVDSSNSVTFNEDVSISGDLYVDGSVDIDGKLKVTEIVSPSFDFSASYIRDTSLGIGLEWTGGYFGLSASVNVPAGITGSIQYSSGLGTLDGDSSLVWNSQVLSVSGDVSISGHLNAETTNIDGSLNVDGSIYQNGVLFTGGGGGTGTGDVAWASGNVGSNNYMITANGDGSIVAEPGIMYDSTATTFRVDGSAVFNNSMGDAMLMIADQLETGDHIVMGDIDGVGYGLVLDVYGIDGSLVIIDDYPDGSIGFMAGSRGHIYLPNIPNSLKSNLVYYNTTSGELSYGALPLSGDVYWASGSHGSSGQMLMSNGDGSIVADPSIIFDTSTLLVYVDSRFNNNIAVKTAVDSTYVISIYGSAVALNGSWIDGSDERFKTEIMTVDKDWDLYMNIRPVHYKERNSGFYGYGYIAQELTQLYPDAVSYIQSADRFGIKYANMVAVNTKHIQELKTEKDQEIDELRQQINNLIAEVSALKNS